MTTLSEALEMFNDYHKDLIMIRDDLKALARFDGFMDLFKLTILSDVEESQRYYDYYKTLFMRLPEDIILDFDDDLTVHNTLIKTFQTYADLASTLIKKGKITGDQFKEDYEALIGILYSDAHRRELHSRLELPDEVRDNLDAIYLVLPDYMVLPDEKVTTCSDLQTYLGEELKKIRTKHDKVVKIAEVISTKFWERGSYHGADVRSDLVYIKSQLQELITTNGRAHSMLLMTKLAKDFSKAPMRSHTKNKILYVLPSILRFMHNILSPGDFYAVINHPCLCLTNHEQGEQDYYFDFYNRYIEAKKKETKQHAQFLLNSKDGDVAPDLFYGIFILGHNETQPDRARRAYNNFTAKYKRINGNADVMQQIPYEEFLINNIHKMATLFAIMGPNAFVILGNLTAWTVHQADRFCQTFQCMPDKMLTFLGGYYAKHGKQGKHGKDSKDISGEPRIWQNILICASAQSQLNTPRICEIIEDYRMIEAQKPSEFYQSISEKLLKSVFGEQEHNTETAMGAEIDIKKAFERIPPDYFAKLAKSSQELNSTQYHTIFNLMLARDCNPNLGTIFDLLHDTDQANSSACALAWHNNSIRTRLAVKEIDPNQALRYNKQHDFYYVEGQDSGASDLIPLQNQILFSYLTQMMDVLNDIKINNETVIANQIRVIEKKYTDLQQQVNSMGAVTLDKHSNRCIFDKILRNLEAIKRKISADRCDIDVSLKTDFLKYNDYLNESSDNLKNLPPINRNEKKPLSYHFSVGFVDKDCPDVFFLGDEVGCCLATDGTNFMAMVERRMDDSILFLVVRDQATGRPAALMWLYLSESKNGDIELRMNHPEVNAKYAANKTLRQALLFSMCEFCQQYVRDNPNIKRFLLDPVSYGWNVEDLKELPYIQKQQAFDKLGGPFPVDVDPKDYVESCRQERKIPTRHMYYLNSLDSDKFIIYDSDYVPKDVKNKIHSVYEIADEFLQSEVSSALNAKLKKGLLTQTKLKSLQDVMSRCGVTDEIWNQITPLAQLQLKKMLRPFCDSDDDYSHLITRIRRDCCFNAAGADQTDKPSPSQGGRNRQSVTSLFRREEVPPAGEGGRGSESRRENQLPHELASVGR